ncbi:MAG: radical SAM protein [Methanomicrobium sp.]|nr:radical SAM protein [Methanomicrobium sp.]MDD4299982.1 radical SAM protein [Methanomicrobium sp.]
MSAADYAYPPILQLESTTACNLKCKFCPRETLCSSDEYIEYEAFKHIVDASKCRYLTLHGWGEPLMHKDLPSMAKYASVEKGMSVNFTTNATLLDKYNGELLDSGLDAIAFSMPTLENFTPLIEINIRNFIAWKKNSEKSPSLKTYINIALMPENFDTLPEMISLAKDTGVDFVNFERSFPWDKKMHEIEKPLISLIKKTSRDIGCEVKLPILHTTPCCLFKNTMFVRTNGDVAPCCYRTDVKLGNVLSDSPLTIIKSRAMFSKKMSRDSICKNCMV